MRRLNALVLLLLLGAMLAGCASSAIVMAPERPDRPWTPATTSSGEIIPDEKPPPELPKSEAFVLPSNIELGELPPLVELDGDKVYSLPELIDIAQMGHPLTRRAWNAAKEAALAAGIAKSAYLPRVTAAAVGGWQMLQSDPAVETARGTISSVSVQWLLFDFGQRAAIAEGASQLSAVANIGFTAAHQQLIHEVSLAFYTNAAARARVGNASQSLRNAQHIEIAADERMKKGIGTVVEVAQARQATAQAKLGLVEAEGAAQNAYLGLLSAMGISPRTKIKVADVSDRRLSPALADSADEVISEALARRPDILAAYAAQKASLANVRAAEVEYLPKLFIASTGTYNSGHISVSGIPGIGGLLPVTNLGGRGYGATALAGVAFPLYDAGERDAILKQAEAKADSAKLTLVHTRDEAVRQIALSNNGLRTSLSAYKASMALSSAAQTTFDAALAAFRSGVGPVTDAISAQTALLQARNASTDAYSTALAAAATLALSTGSLGAAPP
jgi:outer membrane protein